MGGWEQIMKPGTFTQFVVAIMLVAALAVPARLAAQAPANQPHYKLIDLGTFGGAQSLGGYRPCH